MSEPLFVGGLGMYFTSMGYVDIARDQVTAVVDEGRITVPKDVIYRSRRVGKNWGGSWEYVVRWAKFQLGKQ